MFHSFFFYFFLRKIPIGEFGGGGPMLKNIKKGPKVKALPKKTRGQRKCLAIEARGGRTIPDFFGGGKFTPPFGGGKRPSTF